MPRLLVAALLFLTLAATTPVAVFSEELLFNETVLVYPASGIFESIVVTFDNAFPLNSSSALKMSLNTTPCTRDGTECDPANTVFAQAQLYCGTSSDSVLDFVSALPGRAQEIVISPFSPVAYPNGPINATNTTTDTTEAPAETLLLQCVAVLTNYLPTPVQLNFTATGGHTITPLMASEATAAEAIYKTCCTAPGTCEPWNQATEAAGKDFNNGEVFSDLCNIDNNLCDEAGELLVLNFDGYGLSCDITQLNLTGFTNLVSLSLARNNLTGDFGAAVEEWSTELSSLKLLDVGENIDLAGTLSIGNSTTSTTTTGLCAMADNGLEWLGVYKTKIDGEVPSCLFGPGSTVLQLLGGGSLVSGTLPETISTSDSLAVLTLDRTNLTGAIPDMPSSMVKLNLTENAHTGPVPDLSAAKSLTTVDLSNNNLTGPVPDSAANHPSLRFLDLRVNDLTGLPSQWTSASSTSTSTPTNDPPLDTLLVSHNPLNAPFPAGLAPYQNLTFLELADANITGQLPEVASDHSQWQSLDQLYLQNNQMDGPIPDSWQYAYLFNSSNGDFYIHAFVLSNNSFSGNIPEFLAGPYADTIINLAGNEFSNACDPQFRGLGSCNDTSSEDQGGSPAGESDYNDYESDSGTAAGKETEGGATDPTTDDSSSSSGGGLSGGAIAGIVIVVLAVVGIGGFVLYRRRQRHGSGASAGRFTRFEDEGGLEMGGRSSMNASSNVYNPQLAP